MLISRMQSKVDSDPILLCLLNMAEDIAQISNFHQTYDKNLKYYENEKDTIFHGDAENAVESRFRTNFAISF